jgi:hypothetical protein
LDRCRKDIRQLPENHTLEWPSGRINLRDETVISEMSVAEQVMNSVLYATGSTVGDTRMVSRPLDFRFVSQKCNCRETSMDS